MPAFNPFVPNFIGNLTVNGNLHVTGNETIDGTSVHTGLETFNGGIVVTTINGVTYVPNFLQEITVTDFTKGAPSILAVQMIGQTALFAIASNLHVDNQSGLHNTDVGINGVLSVGGIVVDNRIGPGTITFDGGASSATFDSVHILGNAQIDGTISATATPATGTNAFAGNISVAGTSLFTGVATFSAVPVFSAGLGNLGAATATSLAASGAVSGASVTATGAVTGASVVTGEADIRHAAKTWSLSPFDFVNPGSTALWTVPTGAAPWWTTTLANPAAKLEVGLRLPVGETITSIKIYTFTSGSGVAAARVWNLKVWKNAMGANAPVQIGATTAGVGAINTFETITLTGLSETTVAGTTYFVEAISPTNGNAVSQLLGGEAITTRP